MKTLEFRVLRTNDRDFLREVADGVFDHPPDPHATEEFLADPRHHIAVAIDGATVVGMITAIHYVHPDKPVPELWINELGVGRSHRRRGIGKRLVTTMLRHGAELGCRTAWVLTAGDNDPARRLYVSCGGTETAEMLISFETGDPDEG